MDPKPSHVPFIICSIIVFVAIGGGAYAFLHQAPKTPTGEGMMKKEGEAMMKKEETSMMNKGDAMMKAGSYEAYGPEKIARASTDHDVVLFFRASWCPTCISLDKDIRAHLGAIPSNLTILDVNYDNSAELKKKYRVTYQHTFVQVDTDGNLIKKWSGSPTLSALVAEVQ